MATSHNGWAVIDPSETNKLAALPGITGKVRAGVVCEVFQWLVAEYSQRVEEIDPKQSWGYAYRKVREGASWSNHASATAVDFNATRHPFQTGGTMNPRQRAACHEIMTESDNVLRWLEGFDEMHWEIRKGTTYADVAKLAQKIRRRKETAMATIDDAFTKRIFPNPDDPKGRPWSVEDYLKSARKHARNSERILRRLEKNQPPTA